MRVVIVERLSDVRVLVDIFLDERVVERDLELRVPFDENGRADFGLLARAAYRKWEALRAAAEKERLAEKFPLRIF